MPKRKVKFIYWFTYYNLDSPSVRYRAKYPLEFAKETLKIDSYFVIPGYSPKRLFHFLKAYYSALVFPKKDAIIVIQRVRSNFIYANLLKLLIGCRRSLTVYDLDDADYLEHPPKMIHYLAKNCQFIAAGSNEIKQYFDKLNPTIHHITSPIVDLQITKKQRSTIFTIGWVGGFSWGHKNSLYQLVFPAIKALPFECRFVLMGVTSQADELEIRNYFKDAKLVKLEIPKDIAWNDESILQNKITTFDIGIATLLNNPIQIAKSGIKAKQYLNNGVPVLCNTLPENKNVIVNGFNGFLCDNPEEFRNKLVLFKEMNANTYSTFSKNALESVNKFKHNAYFENMETLINMN